MPQAVVEQQTHDDVLLLTLNRPERMNAWTFQMAAELRQAIIAANKNPQINAIVLTGAGRGFCAGADMEAVFSAQQDASPPFADEAATERWVELVRTSKPLVAAINGAAIGVGLSQLMAFDQLIASRDAMLSFRFVKMGVVPELGSSFFVPQRVGFGVASNLMLTGRNLSAEEALAVGLVDAVVSAEALIDAALECARAMGRNPLEAVIATKQLLTVNMAETSLEQTQAREMSALERCYQSPEHHEAVQAFIEKRTPDFARARQQQSEAKG